MSSSQTDRVDFDQIEAFAFDLDGTLFPYYYMVILSIRLFLKHPVFSIVFKEVRRKIREHERVKNFRRLQAEMLGKKMNLTVERAYSIVDSIIYNEWEDMFASVKPFIGVRELLERLRGMKKRIGLLSDYPPSRKLRYLDLENYFDVTMCSDESGSLKPNKYPFEMLAARLEVKPERIIYIGNDQLYDVEGARRAGMKTAIIKPFIIKNIIKSTAFKKSCSADIIFSNYFEFLDLIDN